MLQTIAAAIQFEPKLLEVHENLGTAVQLVHEAAAKGAAVIVLPELCISGTHSKIHQRQWDVLKHETVIKLKHS